MNFEFLSEKIDAYLKDELSLRDRQTLEQMIEQDPILKSEFILQKEIHQAICDRRKLELKQRLSKVEIDEVPLYYNLPKAGLVGTLALAGALTTLLVLFDYSNQPDSSQIVPALTNEKIIAQPKILEEAPIAHSNSQTTVIEDIKPKVETPAREVYVAEAPQKQDVKPLVVNVKPQIQLNEKESINIWNKSKSPLVAKKNTLVASKDELDKPTLEATKIGLISPKESTEIAYETKDIDTDLSVFDGNNEPTLESLSARNRLSYQHINNKLFLYNSGSRGKEIEYMKDGVKRHFILFYDGDLYEFLENQYERADLKLISDINLIQEVKEHLKNK
jgi:hypothetical protein